MKMLSVGCSRFAVVWGHEEAAGVFRRLGCFVGDDGRLGAQLVMGAGGGGPVLIVTFDASGEDAFTLISAPAWASFEVGGIVAQLFEHVLKVVNDLLGGVWRCFHGLSLAWVCWVMELLRKFSDESSVPLPLGVCRVFVAARRVQVLEAPFSERHSFGGADIGGFALRLHSELYL